MWERTYSSTDALLAAADGQILPVVLVGFVFDPVAGQPVVFEDFAPLDL